VAVQGCYAAVAAAAAAAAATDKTTSKDCSADAVQPSAAHNNLSE